MNATTNIEPGSTITSVNGRTYTVRVRKAEGDTAPSNSVPIWVSTHNGEYPGYIYSHNIQSVEPPAQLSLSSQPKSNDSDFDFNESLAEFAIEHRASLVFTYTKANGDVTSRALVPDDILETSGRHTLILGEDEGTGEIRTFRLDRILGRAGLAPSS